MPFTHFIFLLVALFRAAFLIMELAQLDLLPYHGGTKP
jgi:hypothetical protein